jgi:hypothetical protein
LNASSAQHETVRAEVDLHLPKPHHGSVDRRNRNWPQEPVNPRGMSGGLSRLLPGRDGSRRGRRGRPGPSGPHRSHPLRARGGQPISALGGSSSPRPRTGRPPA